MTNKIFLMGKVPDISITNKATPNDNPGTVRFT